MFRKVEISHKTIIFTFFFLGFMYFLYYIMDIVLQLFVALLLMSILHPFIDKLSKYKIPKTLSILFSYIFIFGILGLAIASIFPTLLEQTTNLINNLPGYLQSLGIDKYTNTELLNQVFSQLGNIPNQVISTGVSFFANLLNVITIAIFAFYLLLMRDKLETSLEFLFGKDKSKSVSLLVNDLENKLGGWARGQLALMVLVGVLSYLGLLVLNIPYALPLALLFGIFEIIPYVGPILSAIPAIILGFSISPFSGFAVMALSFLVQQLENYLFVPKIMEKSTGVSPIVTLLSLAIGFRLLGIVGMIISIPLVIIVQTCYNSPAFRGKTIAPQKA